MLERAREAMPDATWVRGDLASWQPDAPADLIFSNAALHWVGRHEELFPRLMRGLRPGGVLAVQIPRNFESPSHAAIREVVRGGPWRARLEGLEQRSPVGEAVSYYDLTAPLSDDVDVWETEYLHVLTGPDPVKEWSKGTALRPLLDALDEPERAEFEKRYAELVARAYPRRADGTTVFPFKRLFIVASRRRRLSA
jgi:trans-aconitate 2-methyltransferase